MNPDRIFRFDVPQQLFVPFNLQLRMKASLHQNPGPAKRECFFNLGIQNFQTMKIRIVFEGRTIKCAKRTLYITNVRVVNVAIDDVAHHGVRMKSGSHIIGGHPQLQQIIAMKELHCIVAGNALVPVDFFENFKRVLRCYSHMSFLILGKN